MVLKKITNKLKFHKRRSCEGKRKHHYLIAIWCCFLLKQKDVFVQPYKCFYGDHYHIGHFNKKRTCKQERYFSKRSKITLLYC